jgi:hypothetical protein
MKLTLAHPLRDLWLWLKAHATHREVSPLKQPAAPRRPAVRWRRTTAFFEMP